MPGAFLEVERLSAETKTWVRWGQDDERSALNPITDASGKPCRPVLTTASPVT